MVVRKRWQSERLAPLSGWRLSGWSRWRSGGGELKKPKPRRTNPHGPSKLHRHKRRPTFLFCVVPCFCLFCFSFFFFSLSEFFFKIPFRMINFSILGGASVVAISHVSYHAKRQRHFFCELFFVFCFSSFSSLLFCLIMFVSPVFFTFSAWIGKTTHANGAVVVRWRCGWHHRGLAKRAVGGWRLAVGGWLAGGDLAVVQLKKPNQDVRIHTAPELQRANGGAHKRALPPPLPTKTRRTTAHGP